MKFTVAVKKKKTRKLPSNMPADSIIINPEIKTKIHLSIRNFHGNVRFGWGYLVKSSPQGDKFYGKQM